MEHLTSLLTSLLRRVDDSEEAREQAVMVAWAAAVGAQVRQTTVPLRLERKTLIVATTDSTWRSQLKLISGQILFKLNSILGSPTVTSIDFVVNERLVRAAHQSTPEVTFHSPADQVLPLMERARSIPNGELRDLFLRAAGKCLDRRAQ